jgi:GTP-binding protein HflX
MVDWIEQNREGKKAYAVGLYSKESDADSSRLRIIEFERLCDSVGFELIGSSIEKWREPEALKPIGKGRIEELKAAAQDAGADFFAIDANLSPGQQRRLEEELGYEVVDRQDIIIRIFHSRARTKEARLQVELAELEYRLPRLSHSRAGLSRQRGGSYGAKGLGETFLELDKRRIKERIRKIREEIEQVRGQRGGQRRMRERSEAPIAALVGYTNAGKTSLLRALAGTGPDAEDKLFATLDPLTRRVRGASGDFLLTDTVGFVRDLPHDLVDAFHATLEEVLLADLIIQVVDCSSPEAEEQYATTRSVLSEIGAVGKPELLVLNKADKAGVQAPPWSPLSGALKVSALSGMGIASLKEAIKAVIFGESPRDYEIPYSEGKLIALARSEGRPTTIEYLEGAIRLGLRLPERLVERFSRYAVD